jgi:hypothetical protein
MNQLLKEIYEVFTAVTVTIVVFWDVKSCGFCKNRRFRESIASIIKVKRISELGTSAVTNNLSTLQRYTSRLASVASYCLR